MKKNSDKNPPYGHGFENLQQYADKHNCVIIGEFRTCRVIKNTKHGRKDTICNVVRAYKRIKLGKPILGYLVGLKEIEFKPDSCKYVFIDI